MHTHLHVGGGLSPEQHFCHKTEEKLANEGAPGFWSMWFSNGIKEKIFRALSEPRIEPQGGKQKKGESLTH